MTVPDDLPVGTTSLKRRGSLLGFASGLLPASLSPKSQAWLVSFLDLDFDQHDYDHPSQERMLAPLRNSGFLAPIAALEALEAFIQTTSAVSPSSSSSTMQTVTVCPPSPSSPSSPCQPLSATNDTGADGGVDGHRRAGSDGTGTAPARRSNAVDSNASVRKGDSRAAIAALSPTFDSMGSSQGLSQSISMPAIPSGESLYFKAEGNLRGKTLSRDSMRTSLHLPGRNAPSMFIHRRPLSIMTPVSTKNLFTPDASRSNSPRPGSTPPTASSPPAERDNTQRDTRDLCMPGAYVPSNASVKTGSDDTPLVTPSSAHYPPLDALVPSPSSDDEPVMGSERLSSSADGTPKPATTDRAFSLDSSSKTLQLARPLRRSPIPSFRAPSPLPASSPVYILLQRANGSAPVLPLSEASRSNSPSLAQPTSPPTSPVSSSSSSSPPSAFARSVSPPVPTRSPYRTRRRGASVDGGVSEIGEMKSEGTRALGIGTEFLEQHHARTATTAVAGPSETTLESTVSKDRSKTRPVEHLHNKREKELRRNAVGLGISFSAPPANARRPSPSGSSNATAVVEATPRKTSFGRLGRGLRKLFTAPTAEPRLSVDRIRRNSDVSQQHQSQSAAAGVRAVRSATVGMKAGSAVAAAVAAAAVNMRSSDDLVKVEHAASFGRSFGLGFDEDVLATQRE
ncbi:hypothetical protein BKA62DRAFT_713765 [Auriculariales sp. MPI-PUGE-AT-0066]|nr:hypothetical protein BKA62DRAFT_713765 [Auriculariales sp. MPI-PUGE-AT-0066]